ncbi:MAG: type II toxin-antitoxin system VapC family toxin [Actinobacteria bacterium]|nr:type II toxin-antitoxin system VapC family toxin [Actinomycetota bacterium]
MIVVDTSVVVAALTGHRPSRVAITGQRLLAPAHVDVEVLHALRGLVRRGTLGTEDAAGVLQVWTALAIDRLDLARLSSRIWELRDNLTAYDAAFIAAAELHDVPLVTADRKLASAPGPRCRIELVPR